MVYFVFVAPMKKLLARTSAAKVEVKADPTEVELLVQIRDLLRTGAVVPVEGPGAPAGTPRSDAPPTAR